MAYNAVNAKLSPNSGLGPAVFDQVSLDSDTTRAGAPRPVSRLSNIEVADVLQSLPGPPKENHYAPVRDGQDPSPPTSERLQYRIFTHWKWEILALLVSIGIVVAMYVLLVEFNDKLVADWRFPINLTTLLALLATVLRAALFVPLTSILAQAKWGWFGDRPRPLQDLQRIENGSRSMLGAVRLVPLAARVGVPTLVAAALSVVSLGIGPFVQQAVGTQTCVRPVSDAPGGEVQAAVPYTHYVSSPGYVSPRQAGNQSSILSMVYSSLAGAVPDPGSEVRFQCTTGNCTFDNGNPPASNGNGPRGGSSVFSTMALCHKCLDVADLLTFEQEMKITTLANLPNNMSLEIGGPASLGLGYGADKLVSKTGNLGWLEGKMDAETRHMAAMALANVTMLTVSNPQLDQMELSVPQRESLAVASTCILYACIRTYSVAVTNGKLREDQLSTTPATSVPTKPGRFAPTGDAVVVKTPCWVGNKTYELSKDNTWSCSRDSNNDRKQRKRTRERCDVDEAEVQQQCYYRQDVLHVVGMMSALDYNFNLDCYTRNGAINCIESRADNNGKGSWAEALYNSNATSARVEQQFASFANSISNRYRMSFGASEPPRRSSSNGEKLPPPAGNATFGQVRGTALQTTACNVVHLVWLTFPAVIAGITAVILLWTVAGSWVRRGERPVWKDNLLPFLLYSHRFKTWDEGSDGASEADYRGDVGGGGDESGPMQHPYRNGNSPPAASSDADDARLLETHEMTRVAKKLQVRFEWPHAGDSESGGFASVLRQRENRSRNVEVDSLMQQ
ncbi:uncharacterized protein PG998_012946 [Apiospora kogelbergensis]|uniref:uncharacterized protein n=1 Tax=Apiospora kogelbergensis TaxID=1337665 RepID=UPI00312EFFA7